MITRVLSALFASVILVGGFTTLVTNQGAADDADVDVDRAVALTRIGAWLYSATYLREEPPEITSRLEEAAKTIDDLESAMVLKGTKIVESIPPERRGQRLDPESLADKAIYDTGARLRSAIRKQREDPGAYDTVWVETKDGVHDVRAPVIVDGRYRALFRLRVAKDTRAVPFPIGLIVVGLIAALLLAAAAVKIPGAFRYVAGALVIVGAVVLMRTVLVDWRDTVRQDGTRREVAAVAAASNAGWLEGATAEELETLTTSLDGDQKGVARKRLLVLHAQTDTSTIVGAAFDAGHHRAIYEADGFIAAARKDHEDLGAWAMLFGLAAFVVFVFGASGRAERTKDAVVRHRSAYSYLSPAMLGMGVLVFVPVVYGVALGFTQRRYNVFEFAGLTNYFAILTDFNIGHPQNFYFTLGVTFLWTASNIFLHVTIGLFFALLLNDEMLKARGLFRVVLILPWAVPSYITALIWKGLFHKQFGAINVALDAIGVGGMSWFQTFWPAYFANLSTNVWLGFPFMMVVSLGALQSIPTDLYEAAIVDGASRWQRFRAITLPLLAPALVPAIIVGTVWTFNMFNVIYLVSGGKPDGATDILITEAFRWAFERDRYGYAAAYATIIFVILLVFTLITNRFTKATKGAFE